MTLIEEIMADCKIMNHIRVDDPFGGFEQDSWEEGASFRAAIIKNGSPEVMVAEQQGASEIYTVVTFKGFQLDYHDVFKRLSDGAIFRVTGVERDTEAPERSTVPIAKVTAERWVIPA